MKRVFMTAAITLLLLIGIALVIIYTGTYDVSAVKPEGSLAKWVFSTTMDHSIRRGADNIRVPRLDDSALISIGFDHYNDMCVSCHGSPAGGRTEAGQGLNPPAPDLSLAAKDWNSAELYWIIKNGIKMTGMPAFGPTHEDNELWGMVAFVQKLPGMTGEQYRSYSGQAATTEGNSAQVVGTPHHKHEHH